MLRGKLTIAILVLLLTTQLAARPLIARVGMRNLAKPFALAAGEAYKEGERLLELRDLLFGKGVGLSQASLSAIKVVDQGCETLGRLSRGVPEEARGRRRDGPCWFVYRGG